ncbi:MAG: Rab family GTPase [Candidatus Odinarchaeia archaeon]
MFLIIINGGDLLPSTYRFKVLLLGDSAVGKTTLVNRFIQGKFSSDYKMTIGVDIMSKNINLNGNEVVLSIWDIAGQDRFRSFRSVFYRGASGALLIFDLTRTSSFENLTNWIDELHSYTKVGIPKIIIGNKLDLVNMRMVKKEDGIKLAQQYNSMYLETSAKTGEGVDEAFKKLAALSIKECKK